MDGDALAAELSSHVSPLALAAEAVLLTLSAVSLLLASGLAIAGEMLAPLK
jgi:hypothetical protein